MTELKYYWHGYYCYYVKESLILCWNYILCQIFIFWHFWFNTSWGSTITYHLDHNMTSTSPPNVTRTICSLPSKKLLPFFCLVFSLFSFHFYIKYFLYTFCMFHLYYIFVTLDFSFKSFHLPINFFSFVYIIKIFFN